MKIYITVAIVFFMASDIKMMAQFKDNVVIAHRGAWKEAGNPQNSIASLQAAIKLGCHASEFDVHLTKDDTLVVNHDPEFYGMDIDTSTYKELLQKKHPNAEKIPTAAEYLKAGMQQRGTKLIFEIKTAQAGKERTLKLTKMAVDLVHHLGAEEWVEYICFDFDAGKYVHQLDPNAKVAYLNGDKTPQEAKNAGYTGLDYHYSIYNKNPSWIKKSPRHWSYH